MKASNIVTTPHGQAADTFQEIQLNKFTDLIAIGKALES